MAKLGESSRTEVLVRLVGWLMSPGQSWRGGWHLTDITTLCICISHWQCVELSLKVLARLGVGPVGDIPVDFIALQMGGVVMSRSLHVNSKC